MKTKQTVVIAMAIAITAMACGSNSGDSPPASDSNNAPISNTSSPEGYDPQRGEGKWNESNLNISGFDATLAGKGESISGTKCFSCHKLSEERLVGPGWKGVTERRTPYWLMNFITNPDPMINKDPEVQAQLELCLVRMPNQSLTDDDARQILEFMRKNDGAQ